ncbi:MAG: heavy-metal-associated domain-containing protein [Ferruginibacter sp.]
MKYKYKTNINCGSCVASVTPHLNANHEIKNWAVDTANPQKILTVETDTLSNEKILEIVNNAGYKAETLSQ